MEVLDKKILITGVSGLLGWNLSIHLKKRGFKKVYGTFNKNHQCPVDVTPVLLNLTDKKSILKTFQDISPDIIIHCAALTNVDLCEKDPLLAFSLNRDVCRNLIEMPNDPKIVYISTDQLWDGSKQFCTEEEPVNPLNIYGQSKYEGELEFLKHTDPLILRTNFFGGDLAWRQSFTGWVATSLTQKKPISAFDDIFFTPLSIFYLVSLLTDSLLSNLQGIFHLVGKERLSKYALARMFAEQVGLDSSLITKSDSSTSKMLLAKRPKEMSLACEKLSKALGKNMPGAQESLISLINSN